MEIIIIIINIFLGLRMMTSVSKIDFGGYGTILYSFIIVSSIFYFIIQSICSYRNNHIKNAVLKVSAILVILIGIPLTSFVMLLLLTIVPK